MTNPSHLSKITQRIDELWVEYSINTEILSRTCRQLAFGEGGICWFFKNSDGSFPPGIMSILLFLTLYFLFDCLQYLMSATLYWILAKFYEIMNQRKKLKTEDDVIKPTWINIPGKTCFILKLIFLGIGSFLLISHFIHTQFL